MANALRARAAPPRAGPDLSALVRDGLGRASRFVAMARSVVLAHGLGTLVPVELPPIAGSPDDARAVAELAPLYFLSELDQAGLFAAGDALAGMYAEGALQGDLTAVENELTDLWRGRHRRFDAAERAAMFRRLFGAPGRAELAPGGVNAGFEALFARFADAVIGQEMIGSARLADRTRMAAAGQQLAAGVVGHGVGVPRLASQELVEQARVVLGIVSDRGVQAAIGLRSPWAVVSALRDPTGPGAAVGVDADIALHVQRARSGVVLLGWLAEQVGGAPGRPAAEPPQEVVAAAFDWLEATLGGLGGAA